VAFAAGGHEAAVADAGAGVVLFHDLAGAGASRVIAPPDDNGTTFSVGFLGGWQSSLPRKFNGAGGHAVGSGCRLAHSHSVRLFPDGSCPHGERVSPDRTFGRPALAARRTGKRATDRVPAGVRAPTAKE
jgi:hypothetical protein